MQLTSAPDIGKIGDSHRPIGFTDKRCSGGLITSARPSGTLNDDEAFIRIEPPKENATGFHFIAELTFRIQKFKNLWPNRYGRQRFSYPGNSHPHPGQKAGLRTSIGSVCKTAPGAAVHFMRNGDSTGERMA